MNKNFLEMDVEYIKVLFVSFLLFFIEILLIHVVQYTTHYIESSLIIGYSLLGIALGGWFSGRINIGLGSSFSFCLLGTWAFLGLALFKILRFPSLDYQNLLLAGIFLFPGFYLSKVFSQMKSSKVYFFDLLGAALAVLCIFIALPLWHTEILILIIFFIIAVVLFIVSLRHRELWFLIVSGLMVLASFGFLVFHISTGKMDVFYLAKQSGAMSANKVFDRNFTLIKSYDNLVSRVEVLQTESLRKKNTYYVSYNGYDNDHFNRLPVEKYKKDIRVVTGLIDNPKVFLLGASAQGVVKPMMNHSSSDRIMGVEINPAIYKIMSEDFFYESNFAYQGLGIVNGNAVAFLKNSNDKFDIITLINLHSMPRISDLGGPDFLHAKESYRMFFKHLTDEGYLMFEERPMNRRGEFGVYRMVRTLYATLKEMGYQRPEDHFFIYSWRGGNRIYSKHTFQTYTGILVKKTPITSTDNEKISIWMRGFGFPEDLSQQGSSKAVVNYWPGAKIADADYKNLFDQIIGSRVEDAYPLLDLSVITKNRPFSSQIDKTFPEIMAILKHMGIWVFIFTFLILFHSLRLPNRMQNLVFSSYQILIGLGYLLVEIIFMNLYFNEFISSPVAFAVTLSVLLVSSGFGGYVLSKASPSIVFLGLCMSFIWHFILMYFALDLVPLYWLKVLLITLSIAVSGYFMGFFMPYGLDRAKEKGLGDNISHYFALNSLAGAFASILALYLLVIWGFLTTALLAVVCYITAMMILRLTNNELK